MGLLFPSMKALLLVLCMAVTVNAETCNFCVLPLIVDGTVEGGRYRTDFLISNPGAAKTIAHCSIQANGIPLMRVEDRSGNRIAPPATLVVLTVAVASGSFDIFSSTADRPLSIGHAFVVCEPVGGVATKVQVSALLSKITDQGSVLAQATVTARDGNVDPPATVQLIADYRGGARLALALTNIYTSSFHEVTLTVDTVGTKTVQVAGVTTQTLFLDELFTLPPNYVGKVLISPKLAKDTIDVLGMRFIGNTFTVIPATVP